MNLMDTAFKDDTSLLVENCSCYTCQHFTKGYVHHLFNCHEMLGVILLWEWERGSSIERSTTCTTSCS